ncbi:MAG: hypothetical protein GXP35_11965, partial [Actinobacteria bacterium]|nr:hypothetical protein [Actinomycetota bacterium]
VIGIMLIVGVGTGHLLIALGALLFVASDTLLATDRFVVPRSDRRMWVHVLYHLGQISIVAGL